MSYTLQLVGGLIDGRTITLSRRNSFLWVDVRSKKERGRDAAHGTSPKPHRILYRHSRWREGPLGSEKLRVREGYVYAGDTYAVCDGCGGYVKRVDQKNQKCSLCGGSLAVR